MVGERKLRSELEGTVATKMFMGALILCATFLMVLRLSQLEGTIIRRAMLSMAMLNIIRYANQFGSSK